MKDLKQFISESVSSVEFDDGLKLKVNDSIEFFKNEGGATFIGKIEDIDTEKEFVQVEYGPNKWFRVPFDNIIDKVSKSGKRKSSSNSVISKIKKYEDELVKVMKARNEYEMEWEDEMGNNPNQIEDGNSKLNKQYDRQIAKFDKKIESIKTHLDKLKNN